MNSGKHWIGKHKVDPSLCKFAPGGVAALLQEAVVKAAQFTESRLVAIGGLQSVDTFRGVPEVKERNQQPRGRSCS